MQDMNSMLRRPVQTSGWHGYNLKTGKNGVRQIEFFTHVLQLVAGGRVSTIRQTRTLTALQALAAEDWISPDQARNLMDLYLAIRRVEHRLQMLSDAQTHSLPRSDAELSNSSSSSAMKTARVSLRACERDAGYRHEHQAQTSRGHQADQHRQRGRRFEPAA